MSELKDYLKKKLKRGIKSGDEIGYIERYTTGIAGLDAVLGGGLPKGRIVQIWGSESTGKSALSLSIIKGLHDNYPDRDYIYIDLEGTITEEDLEVHKISKDRIIFYEPLGGEDAIDTALDALKAGAQLAVIDSVPFLRPKKVLDEIEANATYRDVSAIAGLMERVQSKIVRTLEQCDGTLIFINQERPTKDLYSPPSYPGGTALRFMLSCSIHIQFAKRDKAFPNRVVQNILVRKNKTYTPMLQTYITLDNRVAQRGMSLVDICIQNKVIIQKAGGYYYLPEEMAKTLNRTTLIGRGAESIGTQVEQDKELYDFLYARLLENVNITSLHVEDKDNTVENISLYEEDVEI